MRREARQAELLEEYWAARQSDATVPPPDELDAELAEVVERLERALGSEGPSEDFAAQLQQRLEAEARARRVGGDGGESPSLGHPASEGDGTTGTTDQPGTRPTPLRSLAQWRPAWDTPSLKLVAAAVLVFVVGGLALLIATSSPPTEVGAPTATTGSAAGGGPVPTSATDAGTSSGSGTTAQPTPATSSAGPSGGTGVGTTPQVPASGGPSQAAPGTIAATIPLPGTASPIFATGAGGVWVASEAGDAIWRIDPTSNQVIATIPIAESPAAQELADLAVVAEDGGVWVAIPTQQAVVRIDPATNAVVQTFVLDPPTDGEASASVDATRWMSSLSLAVADGSLWVASTERETITRFDAESGAVLATIAVPTPTGLVIAEGSVWVAQGPAGSIARIDPKSNQVVGHISISLGQASGPDDREETVQLEAITASGDSLFVVVRSGGSQTTGAGADVGPVSVVRIAANTHKITGRTNVPVGFATDSPVALTVGSEGIWIASTQAIARVNLDANEMSTIQGAPQLDCSIACVGVNTGEEAVWVLYRQLGSTMEPSAPGQAKQYAVLVRIDPAQ